MATDEQLITQETAANAPARKQASRKSEFMKYTSIAFAPQPETTFRCIHRFEGGGRCKREIGRQRKGQAAWLAAQIRSPDFTKITEETLPDFLVYVHCFEHRGDAMLVEFPLWSEVLLETLDLKGRMAVKKWQLYADGWARLEIAEWNGRTASRSDLRASYDFSLPDLETNIPWPTTDGEVLWTSIDDVQQFYNLSIAAMKSAAEENVIQETEYPTPCLEQETEKWLSLARYCIKDNDLVASLKVGALTIMNTSVVVQALAGMLAADKQRQDSQACSPPTNGDKTRAKKEGMLDMIGCLDELYDVATTKAGIGLSRGMQGSHTISEPKPAGGRCDFLVSPWKAWRFWQ